MKVLLDTHVFLWWISDDERLSRRARRLIADESNEVLVSVVTALEICLKHAAGRLDLDESPDSFIPDELQRNGFVALPLQLAHVLRVTELPPIHRDPFDRLLTAQTLAERATLITSDRTLRKYPAKTAW